MTMANRDAGRPSRSHHAETRERHAGSSRRRRSRRPPRRPFRDNPRLILAGIGVLVVVLVALLTIARGTTSRFSPDFLSEFVLYALSAADLTMLVALVFVLARNIVKLVVERRRALPFARFRAKLVALLLGMTLVPAVLVLIVGSELIRTNVDRWFNAPMDEILSSANQIAGDYYHERQMLVSDHANRIARTLARGRPDERRTSGRCATCSRRTSRCSACRWSRSTASCRSSGSLPSLEPVLDVAAPALPAGYSRAAADRLAAQALAGSAETQLDRDARHVRRSAARGGDHPRARTGGRPASSSRPTISPASSRRARGA